VSEEQAAPQPVSPLASGPVIISMIISQPSPVQPVSIDFSVEVYDEAGNPVPGRPPIHAEQENLLGALNDGGDYLKMLAQRLSFSIVDAAAKDPRVKDAIKSLQKTEEAGEDAGQ
jgi:hypothetical protein